MIDTKALRSKVLDLAIQGKLTEQLESDGTAEELFAKIQEEKQRLIKEGMAKREKPLPPVSDEEIPFEVPNNWKLVRFSEIIKLQSGQDLTAQEYNDNNNGIPYITGASNINTDGSLIINRWTETPKSVAEDGDILISCKGTVGKITILHIDKVHIARQIMGIKTFYISNVFVKMFMQSVVNGIKNAQKGLIPGIERNDILSLAFPLPPFAEQKRIVERVEEIFKLLDTIDEAQEKYSADAEILKNKLISMGIQGKLTQQLESDGTAEELFAQIQKEKQRLIKEGKIKKENPLPPVSDEEIPFEIPKSWKWYRLGEIVTVLGGKRIPAGRKLTSENTGHKYIRVSDMKNRTVDTSGLLYVPENIYPSISRYIINKEDVYITVAGTIGRIGTIPDEIDGANLTENADRLVFNSLYKNWLVYCLSDDTVQKQIMFLTTQVAQPKLAIKKIQEFYIPLPPLAEQKRIADKLDEILKVIG